MKNKVKREAPMTMLEINSLSQEERENRLNHIRVALVAFHSVLKAAQHNANYIRYHQNMLNKKTVKLIMDAFVEQDYLCTVLDKAFEGSKDLTPQHKESQQESAYEILEHIEDKCIDFIETTMGFKIVQETLG